VDKLYYYGSFAFEWIRNDYLLLTLGGCCGAGGRVLFFRITLFYLISIRDKRRKFMGIFNDTTVEYGGSIKAGSGRAITYAATGVSTGTLTGLIVQQWSLQEERPLTTVFDLTTRFMYYVAGQSRAQVSIEKIVGPQGVAGAFYTQFGNVCEGVKNTITFELTNNDLCSDNPGQSAWAATRTVNRGVTTVTEKGKKKVMADACMLTQVSFAASVQNFMVTESCSMQATGLSLI
jgi:hypothetical protein